MVTEFHLFVPQAGLTFERLVEIAQVSEASGFSGIATMDHLAPPSAVNEPMYEAMVTVTWLAAKTDRISLGQLVLCDAFRHPTLLSKEAVSVDHASGGRFELGIGWGSAPQELVTFGIADPSPHIRVRRLAETLAVLKALWSGEEVNFQGEFVTISAGLQRPTPVSRIPIVIGGAGPRTLDLVAKYADWWNVPITALDRLDELRGSTGGARPSVQLMVVLVATERQRRQTTETAERRFGHFGNGLAIGNSGELAERFRDLTAKGVDRFYVWFGDTVTPSTVMAFGAGVIAELKSTCSTPLTQH